MARSNPETIITNRVRKYLESRGAHFIKLSDSFTRGVPDAVIATTRVVFAEFKVDKTTGRDRVRTYQSLGLSGAQDHHIKAFLRRAPYSAVVITDQASGGRLRLWLPVASDDESSVHYELVAEDFDGLADFMGVRS